MVPPSGGDQPAARWAGGARGVTPVGVGIVAVIAAVWLHLEAGFTYPRPWPDESHFLTAALQLAREASFAVPQLNAPQGVFWLPHGYSVMLAPVAWAADPLDAARWVSLGCVLVFAGCLVTLAVRRGLPPVLACVVAAAWLLSPRVVVAGAIGRMEAPVLALAGLTLVLADRRRWAGAAAAGAVATLLHPMGVVLFAVLAAMALADRPLHGRSGRAEQVAVLLAGVAVIAQIVYFAANASLAAEHLGFQFERKAGRSLSLVSLPAGLLVLSLAAAVVSRRRPLGLGMAVLAAALCAVTLAGQELWYLVLGRETAAVLLLLALFPVGLSRRLVAAVSAAALVLSGVAVAATLRTSFVGMRASTADRAEWSQFRAAALEELRRFDARPGPDQTVLVDPISGFGHDVTTREWQRLEFVQPTPVTPLAPSQVDFVLVSPGVPFVHQCLRELQRARSAVSAASGRGTFRLLLVDADQSQQSRRRDCSGLVAAASPGPPPRARASPTTGVARD